MRATVKRPWKLSLKTKKMFNVLNVKDLRLIPGVLVSFMDLLKLHNSLTLLHKFKVYFFTLCIKIEVEATSLFMFISGAGCTTELRRNWLYD